MARLVPLIGLVVLFSMAGCGGTTDKVRISACGAQARFEFKLHKINCEIANTLIVMLDGRALRQTVALTAEGERRATWVCTSPTHSLVDRLHCQQGAQSFTAERRSR